MDKKTALLKSALKLFTTKGFHNTPTSLISKEANVATGTLFHYFNSKEELINILYLECKRSMVKTVSINLSDSLTIIEKIRLIWENMLNWTQENSDEFLFLQQYHNDSLINQKTINEVESQFTFMEDVINEAIKQKIIKKIPFDLMGEIISSITNATFTFFLNNKDKVNDPEYIESAFNLLFDAIKA